MNRILSNIKGVRRGKRRTLKVSNRAGEQIKDRRAKSMVKQRLEVRRYSGNSNKGGKGGLGKEMKV